MNEKNQSETAEGEEEQDPVHWSNLAQWARGSATDDIMGSPAAAGHEAAAEEELVSGDSLTSLLGSIRDEKKRPKHAAYDMTGLGENEHNYVGWTSGDKLSTIESTEEQDVEYGDCERAIDDHKMRARDSVAKGPSPKGLLGPGAFAVGLPCDDDEGTSSGQFMDASSVNAKAKDTSAAYELSAATLEQLVLNKKAYVEQMNEGPVVGNGGCRRDFDMERHRSRPGAFQVGRGGDEEQPTPAPNGRTTTYVGNTMPDPVTAHVVDPGQEEQMMQERVDHEIEERLGKAPVAEIVPERCSAQRKRRTLVGAVLLIAIVLGVVLGVALKPVPPPEPPTKEGLIELISSASSDGGAALMTNSTPQNQAFEWLVNNNSRLGYYSDARIIQRYALVTFYYSAKGNNWERNENWLDDGDECNRWSQPSGFLACSDTGAVVELDMARNNLQGLIPPEIGLLSSLVELNLKSNALSGTIPTEVAYFDSLESFDLEGNVLVGTVPSEIANMTNLLSLEFDENELTGTIPTVVGKLTALKKFRLNENFLTGTVPLEISKLADMKILNVRSNLLTGVIPTVLGLSTRLEELKLYDNLLSGTIPLEIIELIDLTTLNVENNLLTGAIPTGIGRLTLLEELSVQSNRLGGKVPDEIAELANLKTLTIFLNQLTGTIPTTIGLLTALEELQIWNNEFDGTFPAELGALTKLTSLNVRSNKLVGSVPTVIYNITTLEDLNLGYNPLEGTIPTAVGLLYNLRFYGIAHVARLTGTIPSAIGHLARLGVLELQENMLTGTIPAVVNEMNRLAQFLVYDNNLTGPFTCPEFIADCFVSCDDGFNESCRSL